MNRKFLFLLLVSCFAFVNPILPNEVKATKLELEAEEAEKKGDTRKAESLRIQAATLRKYFFRPFQDGYLGLSKEEREKKLPSAISFSNNLFLGGSWELGFRFISNEGFFYPGRTWADDDGAIAFQGNSFFKPRGGVGYQNIEPLPFSSESLTSYGRKNALTPKVLYKHNSKKWALEYSNVPFQTGYNYYSVGFINNPLTALHDSRIRIQDHKLVLKIYDELTKDMWFSWDFGLRMGQIKTDTAYTSASLGEGRSASDVTNFTAASAGFKFYHTVIKEFSYEVGGDLFLTPFGSLRYNRTVLKNANSFDLYRGGNLAVDEAYSIRSSNSLRTDIAGLDILVQANFMPISNHKLSLGVQSIQYSFRANESRMPTILALSEESYLSGLRDYYFSSAFYEADGNPKRPTRSYSIINYYFGYTYVF